LDPALGWRIKESIAVESQSADALGRTYDIHYFSGPQGFRIFGEVTSQKTKILFIGDSFTHDATVSNAKMFPALLAWMLDFEAFSLASGGWGNLQEVMAFEKVRDYIQPDIIIWPLCKNDFINNHYELEKRSALNNNLYKRPYLSIDNEVFMTRPVDNTLLSHLMDLNERLEFRSRLLTKFSLVLQTIWIKQHIDQSIENEIAPTTCHHPLFDESLRITDLIFSRMSAAAGDIPVVAFGLDWPSCFDKNFQKIALRHGFSYATAPGEHLNTLNYKGDKNHLAADNAHWNEEGNRIVANTLRQDIDQVLRKTIDKKQRKNEKEKFSNQ
jgi:hypothetical protein